MPFLTDPFQALIARFGLHADDHDPLVNLAPCEALFTIERFPGTRRRPSWALPSGAPMPTPQDPAIVFLSDHLADAAARVIYAPEYRPLIPQPTVITPHYRPGVDEWEVEIDAAI